MEGIHTSILSKIFALDKIPTMINEWYDKTSRFDAQYRRFQEISSQNKGFTPQARKTNAPRYVHSPRDPNAMDIDRLTTEDRELCMKERLLSSEFGRRCRVRSRARRWLQLVGCAALLMDASNFGGPDGVRESGVEPRRSLRRQEGVKEK